MMLMVNGVETYVSTGGKGVEADLPIVLFLHGSGMDHHAFASQIRWFADNGFGVLAPDFPGHSLSAGKAIRRIEDAGKWLLEFFNAAGVVAVHLVGHSQGFLSALELAAARPERVRSLTGIATAAAIPVNPVLIETARSSVLKAADLMLKWGFGRTAQLSAGAAPDMQPIAISRQIMSANPLAVDLRSCADYVGGDAALKKVRAPCSMILAREDKMTPIEAGLTVAEALNARLTVLEEFGHMLPIEAPMEVISALRQFIIEIEDGV